MSHLARVRALAGTAGLLLLTPVAAHGQDPAGAQSFCVLGDAGRCFAFAITDEAAGFDVWLRNLSAPADGAANPFAIRDFGLHRVNAATAGGERTDVGSGFTNRNVATTGGALRGPWSLDENTSAADFPGTRTFSYTASGSYGLLGCGLPSAPDLAAFGYVAITCADRGLDGWLRVSFGGFVSTESGVGRAATRADVAVQVAGCTTHVGALSGADRGYPGAASCAPSLYSATVAPEPSAAWLVGAGAAGMWGAARARRRTRG
jgi:hypothetical protein